MPPYAQLEGFKSDRAEEHAFSSEGPLSDFASSTESMSLNSLCFDVCVTWRVSTQGMFKIFLELAK
jgi:hypothetical protein